MGEIQAVIDRRINLSGLNIGSVDFAAGLTWFNDTLWFGHIDDNRIFAMDEDGGIQSSFFAQTPVVNTNNLTVGLANNNGFLYRIIDDSQDDEGSRVVHKYNFSGALIGTATTSWAFIASLSHDGSHLWTVARDFVFEGHLGPGIVQFNASLFDSGDLHPEVSRIILQGDLEPNQGLWGHGLAKIESGFYYSNQVTGKIYQLNDSGQLVNTILLPEELADQNQHIDLTYDGAGRIWLADWWSSRLYRIIVDTGITPPLRFKARDDNPPMGI